MIVRNLCLAVAAIVGLAACEDATPVGELVIVSGSENRALQPIVEDYCREARWTCRMEYRGSVDIKLALQDGETGFDAVWPAHSRWIELGDDERRVKHVTSIFQSPVVLGVRKSLAEDLGLTRPDVTMADILSLVNDGRLRFLMTSATQSNSGFSAYIAMLTTLAGKQDVLTAGDLKSQALQGRVQEMLRGVARTSGSSGWLKELYLEAPVKAYDAMWNYEALLIEANAQAREREALYAVYPADGVAIADSPLGFVSRDNNAEKNAEKEAFFLQLQAHLLSPPVQERLLSLGRRTGFGGTIENADRDVFDPDLGFDLERVLTSVRFPPAPVIEEALALYQETLRKPSLLALCLDFSGSMGKAGEPELKEAIRLLFDRETSRRFMLQAGARDVFVAIPFNHEPGKPVTAQGETATAALVDYVASLQAHGGTDIYSCARRGIEALRARPEIETHIAGVILMTDGKSEGDPDGFARYYRNLDVDVPVFAITFGKADPEQLEALAELTRSRVFDGNKDLRTAFRQARGYN